MSRPRLLLCLCARPINSVICCKEDSYKESVSWKSLEPVSARQSALSRRAVAFLVFLPRAAGARVITANLRPRPDRLGRLSLGRTCLKLEVPLLPPLALFYLFGLVLGFGRLHQEQEPYRLGVDPVH